MLMSVFILASNGSEWSWVDMVAPCLLPEFSHIKAIRIVSPRYWAQTIDLLVCSAQAEIIKRACTIYVKRKTGTYVIIQLKEFPLTNTDQASCHTYTTRVDVGLSSLAHFQRRLHHPSDVHKSSQTRQISFVPFLRILLSWRLRTTFVMNKVPFIALISLRIESLILSREQQVKAG